jgi:hypothetical protein
MKRRRVFSLLVMVSVPLIVGCRQPAVHHAPIHRFENVTIPGESGVALDTVTGQLCKTWLWAYKADSMSGGLDTLPTCVSIFEKTH